MREGGAGDPRAVFAMGGATYLPPRQSVLRHKIGRVGEDLDAAISFADEICALGLVSLAVRDALREIRDDLAVVYNVLSE